LNPAAAPAVPRDVPEGWNIEQTRHAPVEVEIGMRWLALWRLAARPWVPLAAARMVLPSGNDGLLRSGVRLTWSGPALVQVWDDHETVQGWSRDSGASHAAARKRFAREASGTASWGIWHRVRATPN
jgi:hypothetical protein